MNEREKTFKEKITMTENEYNAALIRIAGLMNAEKNTDEGKELIRLSILIEEYENKHFPFSPPTSDEAKKFRMDQENNNIY